MLQEVRVLWTQVAKVAVIVAGAVCLILAYNWWPYWTRKSNWVPKSRTGQIFLVFALYGFFLVYIICAYTVYAH